MNLRSQREIQKSAWKTNAKLVKIIIGVLEVEKVPRGKQTDNETIYKVMLSVFRTNSFSETARELNMPISTVRDLYNANIEKQEFVKLRQEKTEEFIEKADKIINKALNRLDKELDDDTEKIPVNNLSTVIGTLYDKRALAKGEPTSNEKLTINIELSDD